MADMKNTDGAPPSHIHIEKKKTNWFAWLLLLLGLLALLFALFHHRHRDTTAATSAPAGNVVAATPTAGSSTVLANTSALGSYLAGKDAAPRTFTFEKLNFDTNKSDIRAADQDEIGTIATTLKQYPTTHVRIAGYADARGDNAANVALGKSRADSVKAALVAKGIDAGRIDTASGGAGDPVATNATAAGQFENRRTELVVTSR